MEICILLISFVVVVVMEINLHFTSVVTAFCTMFSNFLEVYYLLNFYNVFDVCHYFLLYFSS